MKKALIIIGVIVAIVVVTLTVVFVLRKGDHNVVTVDTQIVNTINDNSNLPVKYMAKYEEDDNSLKKYDRLNNYMSYDFRDDDIFFSYYGYPNDESDFYLGEIGLSSTKYNLLGVTLGDDMRQSISKLESYGFKTEENHDYFSATLVKDDYTIEIESDIENDDENHETVGSIKISVDSKYLGNRIY